MPPENRNVNEDSPAKRLAQHASSQAALLDALAERSLEMSASAADDVVRSVDAALSELQRDKAIQQAQEQSTFRAYPVSLTAGKEITPATAEVNAAARAVSSGPVSVPRVRLSLRIG